MILLIDNYDSFSYNLYQLVGAIDPNIRVVRNDELSIEEIDALHPDARRMPRASGHLCRFRCDRDLCQRANAR